MAIRPVLLFGDPRLRKPSEPVKRIQDVRIVDLRRDLYETLGHLQLSHRRGGGLAAPQIGALLQLVCIRVPQRTIFLHNPEILDKSQELFEVWDFCFSAKAAFMARVIRHRHVTLRYLDEEGNQRQETFSDYMSELMQHELDHLQGVLFIDRITAPDSLMMAEEYSKRIAQSQS